MSTFMHAHAQAVPSNCYQQSFVSNTERELFSAFQWTLHLHMCSFYYYWTV